ncbi:hypothetical protein BDR04DRAFT_21290 [Suillus decipiens]|nr:hypothetical protein BDR04DRAFT_21290 [Suillus decipiens]
MDKQFILRSPVRARQVGLFGHKLFVISSFAGEASRVPKADCHLPSALLCTIATLIAVLVHHRWTRTFSSVTLRYAAITVMAAM